MQLAFIIKQAERLLLQMSSDESKLITDVQAVDVDSLVLLNPRTVGVEAVGLWAM